MLKPATPTPDLDALKTLDDKLRFLSSWTIHHANHVRESSDGLVTRTVTPTIPPRVDYELTELGVSLRQPVRALGEWAIEHIACIRAAQERFDQAAS